LLRGSGTVDGVDARPSTSVGVPGGILWQIIRPNGPPIPRHQILRRILRFTWTLFCSLLYFGSIPFIIAYMCGWSPCE
jgi:hypothetical protein